jgi:hypothetical protein
MAIPTKEPLLLDRELELRQQPSAPVAESSALMFERLLKDTSVDVDKLERFMQLQERQRAISAKDAFNAALSAAQAEMRPVAADASNPQTKSRYASYEALDRALRPIYTKHGFALSFNTGDAPLPDFVRVLCDVTHAAGHEKPYKIDMPSDGKGAKGGDVMTKTHAAGSAVSYGMRYLLKMIFNVAVGEDDDDGNRASVSHAQPKRETPPPSGYEDWLTDMEAAADEGWPKLSAAFGKSKQEYRKHVTGPDKTKWAALRAKAEKVQK